MKILSFGEIIWDIYPDKKCIGGAPLNFAAHLSKRGVDSYLISAVGDDLLGKEAVSRLEDFRVKTDYISVIQEKSTGTCTVLLDKRGVPTYRLAENTAYDEIRPTECLMSQRFDAIAFGTLALRCENNRHSLKEMMEKGIADRVFCDLNLRLPFYNEDTVRFALESANILKISDTELDYLKCEILRSDSCDYKYLLSVLCKEYTGIELVLLTCGENGAYVYTASDGKIRYRMAKRVDVVSTVGAGDSFGAVFLADYLSGRSLDICLDNAIEVSAAVVSRREAVPSDI